MLDVIQTIVAVILILTGMALLGGLFLGTRGPKPLTNSGGAVEFVKGVVFLLGILLFFGGFFLIPS